MWYILFPVLYLVGAISTFKIWVYRFPPKYGYRDNYSFEEFIEISNVENGEGYWYTDGYWVDHQPPYNWTVENAFWVCVGLWWGIPFLMMVNGVLNLGNQTASYISKKSVKMARPNPKKALPTPDPYLEGAMREVNKLVSGEEWETLDKRK